MNNKKTVRKSRLHRVLTKRIHHNRWLFYAISIAVIVFGSLFAYIQIANLNDTAQQVFIGLQPRPLYANTSLGFTVDYPNGWVIDSSTPATVTFDNPKNSSDSIDITTGTLASATKLQKSASAKVVSTYDLRGNQITILSVGGPEGGTPMSVGIIRTASKAYFVSGSTTQFNSFVNDIRPQ